MKYLIRQIKVAIKDDISVDLKKIIAHKLKIDLNLINEITISKKSLDARNKNEIFYVYEVIFSYKGKIRKNQNVTLYEENKYQINIPKQKKKVVVVGSGPAGLMAAYILSKTGNDVLIIERGDCLEKRKAAVELFWQTGKLNQNSNVQFGEGGAGTFSDGKLNTQIKDKDNIGKLLLEVFCQCGASSKIMYEHNPHLGTDKLFDIIKNLRKKIINYGGKFLYNTTLTDIVIENNILKSVEINNKEKISCDKLILAIGHSARDTFQMLYKRGIILENKPFAVGVRVEHNQQKINKHQYGKYSEVLPPAAYKLTYTTKAGRGVYSFCMCPGGYVVNASSISKHLAINGMSYSQRDSNNANSAIIVTVSEKDYGFEPLAGLNFQNKLEAKAYEVGNGLIPCMLYQNFKNNNTDTTEGSIHPVIKGSYTYANIRNIFPKYINDSIVEAMEKFGQLIEGFNADDVVLSAVESRTSSPIRIVRNCNFECNVKNIYPCGEGSGYAGGITSSAIDGIKVANFINKD